MTFKKGQSGNPNGRPKHVLASGKSVAELARDYTERAVETLVEVMEDSDAPKNARVSAAEALLDRGWGKPKQEMDLNVKTEREAILERMRERVHGQPTAH
jgi:uncharacterized protein (UPF0147 family)